MHKHGPRQDFSQLTYPVEIGRCPHGDDVRIGIARGDALELQQHRSANEFDPVIRIQLRKIFELGKLRVVVFDKTVVVVQRFVNPLPQSVREMPFAKARRVWVGIDQAFDPGCSGLALASDEG